MTDLQRMAEKEAKKHTTDDKLVQLLARLYVSGYKAAMWEFSEGLIKETIEKRNKTLHL